VACVHSLEVQYGTVPGIWNRVDVAVDELCFLRTARRAPLHKDE
jgi:hypothetical protein